MSADAVGCRDSLLSQRISVADVLSSVSPSSPCPSYLPSLALLRRSYLTPLTRPAVATAATSYRHVRNIRSGWKKVIPYMRARSV